MRRGWMGGCLPSAQAGKRATLSRQMRLENTREKGNDGADDDGNEKCLNVEETGGHLWSSAV